jgi:two-component system response regulator HydG
MKHDWPGNVRELEQTLNRAALLADGAEIEPRDLGLASHRRAESRPARHFDRERVLLALESARGNRTRAAQALGVSRMTLHRWIRSFGIAIPSS